MAARPLIHHKTSALKSLQVFYTTLPEFSEIPTKPSSVVDKAFEKSIIQGISDVRS